MLRERCPECIEEPQVIARILAYPNAQFGIDGRTARVAAGLVSRGATRHVFVGF
jgi:hypothetical protein